MYKLNDFLALLEEFAPLSLSKKMIERGDYDNSGIIVESHDSVEKVLFTLDLSNEAVNYAVELGCDTVVTHHPPIYAPIKNLSCNGQTSAVFSAVKSGLNVISMHLNLDVATSGIDYSLAECLGAKESVILDNVFEDAGYGRKFNIGQVTLSEFVKNLKEKLNTEKVICYGDAPVSSVASFCGAGGSNAVSVVLNGGIGIDTVVSSDLAHHHILALVENKINVVIIPHYVSEEYGFNKFYERVTAKSSGGACAYYFADKRFM